jgi:phage/plasmid primase-like uncharacterized protein
MEYDSDQVAAHTLDGKVTHCRSCSALGRVSVDDENGRIQFIPLTLNEIANVGDSTLIDAYWASQKRIDELYEEVSVLRMQLKATNKRTSNKDIHTEHCTLSGCKYGDEDCTVVTGKKLASFPDQEEW